MKNDLDSQDALNNAGLNPWAEETVHAGFKPAERHGARPQDEREHPITTKSLANDGGLEDLLKKIGGISIDDPLGATGQPFSVPHERVDNNLQVFLGTQHQARTVQERRLDKTFAYS